MSTVLRSLCRINLKPWASNRFYAFSRFLLALSILCVFTSAVSVAYAPEAAFGQPVSGFDLSFHASLLKTTEISPVAVNAFFEEDVVQLIQEPAEQLEPQETSFEVAQSTGPIPNYLYLHFDEASDDSFYWVPSVSEEKISENDILVDLNEAICPESSYTVSEYYRHLFALTVYREAGNQPFLGMLLVAEGLVGRCRSGNYGTDISAILTSGYRAQADENGNLHIYRQNGEEILEPSQSAIDAVDLALSGSQVSNLLLQSITQVRNEQYGLQLNDSYYKWCAIYHFNPDLISETEVQKRTINRVPVSFRLYDHIFYGYWLPESAQLDL